MSHDFRDFVVADRTLTPRASYSVRRELDSDDDVRIGIRRICELPDREKRREGLWDGFSFAESCRVRELDRSWTFLGECFVKMSDQVRRITSDGGSFVIVFLNTATRKDEKENSCNNCEFAEHRLNSLASIITAGLKIFVHVFWKDAK